MNAILRSTETTDWITMVLFGSLLFVLIAKSLYYTRFLNFIVLPFNNKYIFMYNKKERLLNRFHILFTIFQVINTSLFLFLVYRHFIYSESASSPYTYPTLLIAIFIFTLIKIILQLTNGFIFGSQAIFSELIFKKMSYINYGGIILFMANIMLTYVNTEPKVVIFTAIILFLGINVIGWILVLKNYQNLIANYFLYFILYLCTLEIAPLVIVGSFLK